MVKNTIAIAKFLTGNIPTITCGE